MASETLRHLLQNVVPASQEYFDAEEGNSVEESGPHVLRKASEVCIAIDGLADRASTEFKMPKADIIQSVEAECRFPGGADRPGCINRIRGVANAYKHSALRDLSLPISSEKDVMFYGPGYGIDGFGVGKMNGNETLIRDKSGLDWKLLGDIPCAVNGWASFLRDQGVEMPGETYLICNLPIEI